MQADGDEDEARQLEKIAETGAWGVYFDAQPHSNGKLMGLIPPALEALGTSDSSNAWNELTDLPEAVPEWIRGQTDALFTAMSYRIFRNDKRIGGIY
ncbi:hypothetical protein Trisim1_010113 [Trichoderma cf. simile WF8]